MSFREPGIQGECAPVERYRFARLPERPQGIARIHQRLDVVRLNLEGAAQAHQSFRPKSLIVQGRPEIAVSFAIQRLELGGSAQRRQCIFTLAHEGHAENFPKHPGPRMCGQQRTGPAFGFAQKSPIEQRDERVDVPGIERSR